MIFQEKLLQIFFWSDVYSCKPNVQIDGIINGALFLIYVPQSNLVITFFFGYFFLTLCLIRSKSPNRSYTSYGLCLTFNGELEDQSKLVAFGRKAQLSFVGIYSKNNWK